MKKYVIFGVSFILSLLLAAGFAYKRFDYTSDQRYTLSNASLQVLDKVDSEMNIKVYLDGDFPANFQQFKQEVNTLLDEFQNQNPNIQYKFINPNDDGVSQDTLIAMGMTPSRLPEQRKGKIEEVLIFPYAFITIKDRGIVVPLLTGKKAEINEVIKASIEELEYNFIENIDALSEKEVKSILWLNNHQTVKPLELNGLYQALSSKYILEAMYPFDSNQVYLKKSDLPFLRRYDAVFIAKPRDPFQDEEKLVLDQYIMNGGKILWMVDAVNAEKDSLSRSGKITAFSNDLNINDLLFSYGIRLQGGVIKDDQKSAVIKIQVGEVQGNPEFAYPQWPYWPIGISDNEVAITKNLNPVLFQFASPIDTLNNGIKKTVLYRSSPVSDVIPTPTFVYLEDVVEATEDSLLEAKSHHGNQIMAISLEGKFPSAYKGRFEKTEIPNFQSESPMNKMIFIADGDIGVNEVYQGKVPVPLGLEPMTNIQYDNGAFLLNCFDYLLDDTGLMQLRNRTIDQRLLDNQKVLSQKSKWKNINLLVPSLFILICMIIGVGMRNKIYK